MRPKTWVYDPHKQKRSIDDETRQWAQRLCDNFVLKYLRPCFVRPFNSKNKKEAHCVDVQWKWYRHFIHFKALYKDGRPNAREAQYESPITRLEYMNEGLFHLAYFRHTGEWWTITFGDGESLGECFQLMRTLPHFQPVI